jgi:hypothetical protein
MVPSTTFASRPAAPSSLRLALVGATGEFAFSSLAVITDLGTTNKNAPAHASAPQPALPTRGTSTATNTGVPARTELREYTGDRAAVAGGQPSIVLLSKNFMQGPTIAELDTTEPSVIVGHTVERSS